MNIKRNEDGFEMFLVRLDICGLGKITIEVCGEDHEDAVKLATETLCQIKPNDIGVLGVGLVLEP